MLFILLALYTKKYWKRIFGVKMSCADNNIIEKRKKLSIIFWIIIILFSGMSLYLIYIAYVIIGAETNNTELGLGFISVGLGILSISGIFLSFKNTFNNNTKAIQEENQKFQRILHDFEGERIHFLGGSYNVEAYIWRSRTQLERAYELDKKYIKCRNHHRLIQYFIVTLDVLFHNMTWFDLADNQQHNVQEMYRMVREFERSGQRQENNFSTLLQRMDKSPDETEEQFYNRLFGE